MYSSRAFRVTDNDNKEDSMGNQTVVLYVISAALLVFYMMRRRNRMSWED